MAVTTTNITGMVLLPSGAPATGGKLRARLSSPGSVEDGATTQRIGGVTIAEIGSDGSVDFTLVPNDVITPEGSIYAVEYQLLGGSSWQEFWAVETGSGSIDIGDISRVNP
jgi:hypothetical protein